MSILRKTFRFRMRPSKAQEASLLRMAGARRFVYNWALRRRSVYYLEHGRTMPAKQLSSELTALKKQPETTWLNKADSQALQQALMDLDRAFKRFFDRCARYPRYRSKKRDRPTFRIPQRISLSDGCVIIPKIGRVRIRQSQGIDGIIKGATFTRDAACRWYVAINVEIDVPSVPLPVANRARVVGVDVGLKNTATLSDGSKIEAPQYLRRVERKVARAQRALKRKKPGSNNSGKAKVVVARIHERVRNQRQDFLHKLTTSLIGRVDGVCIEDLSLKGMARTKLSKSVYDAALGEFRRQLEYKTAWNRKHLAVIDRFYPSSKQCGACSAVNMKLRLGERFWTCTCGASHDRDVNAARNIRVEGLRMLVAAGHAETQNACGGNIRPLATGWQIPVKQESHRA